MPYPNVRVHQLPQKQEEAMTPIDCGGKPGKPLRIDQADSNADWHEEGATCKTFPTCVPCPGCRSCAPDKMCWCGKALAKFVPARALLSQPTLLHSDRSPLTAACVKPKPYSEASENAADAAEWKREAERGSEETSGEGDLRGGASVPAALGCPDSLASTSDPSPPADVAMEAARKVAEELYYSEVLQDGALPFHKDVYGRLATIIRAAIDKETEGLREALKAIIYVAREDADNISVAGDLYIESADTIVSYAQEALNRSKKI